ncbi:Glycosyl transferase family 90 [Devosia enhydra]|uniref:Glycosyl transferase family 90 n=1 Tax=Devosia enhydra TaxID=665118 RepID=A0A1K2HT59_9HYPH|nr:glycosyl transferase family 90 [Devosia enhydra]SFZ81068.1 Glycosyl transferase family 90 [Devosia enhydra]
MTHYLRHLRDRLRVASYVRRQLRPFNHALPRLAVDIRPQGGYPYDVELRRTGDVLAIGITFHDRLLLHWHVRRRLAPYIHYLLESGLESACFTVATSDGQEPTQADFAYSSNDPSVQLLPDAFFFDHRGFAADLRLADETAISWNDRRDAIVWRGGSNGIGALPWPGSPPDNPRLAPRVSLCLLAREIEGLDAGIYESGHPFWPNDALDRLGLRRPARPEAEWLGDKFAIDIDGWTNTWTNLLRRLHYGCCVLKVESAFGYRQWYYDRLQPWQHYIPIRADMADLGEKIDWARTYPTRSSEVARAGQEFARSLTFESETRWAAEKIAQRLG